MHVEAASSAEPAQVTSLAPYLWSPAMVDADERMPRLLGEAAKRYREESKLVRSQIAGPLAAGEGAIKRFEAGRGGAPGSRVGIEELLDIYVSMCGLDDRWEIYERAIRIARSEESPIAGRGATPARDPLPSAPSALPKPKRARRRAS
jgi:hypothetical protein